MSGESVPPVPDLPKRSAACSFALGDVLATSEA